MEDGKLQIGSFYDDDDDDDDDVMVCFEIVINSLIYSRVKHWILLILKVPFCVV